MKKFKRKEPILIPVSPAHPFIVHKTGANFEQEKLDYDIRTGKAGKNKTK
jgi:hypothetical protein